MRERERESETGSCSSSCSLFCCNSTKLLPFLVCDLRDFLFLSFNLIFITFLYCFIVLFLLIFSDLNQTTTQCRCLLILTLDWIQIRSPIQLGGEFWIH